MHRRELCAPCVLPAAGSPYIRVPGDLKGDPQGLRDGLTLGGNTIYAPDKNCAVNIGGSSFTLAEFQADGFDQSSTLSSDVPDAATMVSWMETLLGMS